MERQLAKDKKTSVVDAELARISPAHQELKETIASRASEIDALEKMMRDEEDEAYASFSRVNGVPNVLEAEERATRKVAQLQEKLRKIASQKVKLEGQMRYTESQISSRQTASEKIRTSLKDMKSTLQRVQAKSRKLEDGVTVLSQSLAALESACTGAKSAHAVSSSEVRKATTTVEGVAREKTGILKRITSEETEGENLEKRHEVLREASLDSVDLPRKRRRSTRRSGTPSSISSGDAPLSQGSLAVGSNLGFSQSDASAVRQDAHIVDDIDFSSISHLTDDFDAQQCESQIRNAAFELETMQPNMRAQERFDDISKRLKSTGEKLATAREASKRADIEFEEVRRKRNKMFMDVFQHVESVIDDVYKNLTRSLKHSYGGTAYLTLEDPDEPFNTGITFNNAAHEAISGHGAAEWWRRLVAALALLFAIYSVNPAPFLVLDEVDAALDNVNVSKVSNYIKKRANDFQCVVISLKDSFYEKADALWERTRMQQANLGNPYSGFGSLRVDVVVAESKADLSHKNRKGTLCYIKYVYDTVLYE